MATTDQDAVPVLVAGRRCNAVSSRNQPKRERDEHLPAEVHQLVVAEPGQRGPEPDVDEQEDEQLRKNQSDALDASRDDRDVEQRPRGPPKNSVTMIADIVTTFMNSAR